MRRLGTTLVLMLLASVAAACGGNQPASSPAALPVPGERPPGATYLSGEQQAALGELGLKDQTPFQATFTQHVKLTERDYGDVLENYPKLAGTDYVYVHTVWFQGETAWRLDILEDNLPRSKEFSSYHQGGGGSFIVWDGKQLGHYNAAEGWFYRPPDGRGDISRLELISRSKDPRSVVGCLALPNDQVAGHVAQHLRCEAAQEVAEFWFDAETGLLLKLVNPKEGFSIEVTSVEYDPVFPAGIFQFVPPPGARDFVELQKDAYYHTDLVQGQVAPSWRGPLRGGGTLDLKSLRGRPVLILFTADWCDRACDVLPQVQEVSQQWGARASFITIFLQSQDAGVDAIIEKGSYTFQVVLDSSGKVGEAWGVQSAPLWVLLDAEGRVVEARIRPQTLAELNELMAKTAR